MKSTIVLAATEVDAARCDARRPGNWPELDPPTTDQGILASVQDTEREIAATKRDPQAAMDLVARQAEYLTDASGAVVEIVERTELVYRAASGSAVRSIGVRVEINRSLSGLCFRTQQAVRCDDTEADAQVDKAACRWVGIRSMVLVPVTRNSTAIGVLAVISPTVAAFAERDVRTMQLLASVLADALEPKPGA